MSGPSSPAVRDAGKVAVVEALDLITAEATQLVKAEITPAVDEVAESQQGLDEQLCLLNAEMAKITTGLESVTLDPETSARMEDTKEVLKRTKKKLTTIRGRLGRLRLYEESDRLHVVELQPREGGPIRGENQASAYPGDLWDEQQSSPRREER